MKVSLLALYIASAVLSTIGGGLWLAAGEGLLATIYIVSAGCFYLSALIIVKGLGQR